MDDIAGLQRKQPSCHNARVIYSHAGDSQHKGNDCKSNSTSNSTSIYKNNRKANLLETLVTSHGIFQFWTLEGVKLYSLSRKLFAFSFSLPSLTGSFSSVKCEATEANRARFAP